MKRKKITAKKFSGVMFKHIFHVPTSCNMGTGVLFKLISPVTGDVIKSMRYIDVFDVSEFTDDDVNTVTDSDMTRYYEEFKSNILQYARPKFEELCKPILLYVLNLELI